MDIYIQCASRGFPPTGYVNLELLSFMHYVNIKVFVSHTFFSLDAELTK